MAAATVKDRDQEPLHLRQGGKLFSMSRLLTRDRSVSAPSFRVYYGVASAGSVPFLWESQPGTPKNDAVSASALPPLTPPPSYYVTKEDSRKAGGNGRKCKQAGILGSILPKIVMARWARPSSGSPSSCSSSSSSSSSTSSSSSSLSSFLSIQSPACSSTRGGGSNRLHASSSFSDEEEMMATVTCFRVRHESFRALRGCRVAVTVRSALAYVGGSGHCPSTAAAAQRV